MSTALPQNQGSFEVVTLREVMCERRLLRNCRLPGREQKSFLRRNNQTCQTLTIFGDQGAGVRASTASVGSVSENLFSGVTTC